MKPLWNSLIAVSLLAIIAACSQTSSGLVGDYQAYSKCPANGCASQTASENYLSITSPTSTINLGGSNNPFTIGGECYASLYPNNYIAVTAPSGSVGVSNKGSDVTVRCYNGRFEVTISGASMAAGSNAVKLQLIAVDAAGATHVNSSTGVKTVTVIK
jgi:hypothetical protein